MSGFRPRGGTLTNLEKDLAPDPARGEGYSASNVCPPTTTPASSLPTDVTALHSIINTLQGELKTATSINAHLAASVARLADSVALQLQLEHGPLAATTPTPTTTTTTTTPSTTNATLRCPHADNPCTIASGSGAASPAVFQEIIKTNWHGRLGRTHMVDVDALPATALTELDCFLRRKLHATFPRERDETGWNADEIFASLAALGLRLEDRGQYADVVISHDRPKLMGSSTIKRARNSAAWYLTHENHADYWLGSGMETVVDLARYRGLFDYEGYLKE